MNETLHYPGEELELFGEARQWKRYFARKISPWISGRVLEAGAGMGGTTPYLWNDRVNSWTCLEPDPELFAKLEENKARGELPGNVILVNGTLSSLPAARYDTILYIDVLEHIEKDGEELEKASALLEEGGHLIVLSPAYPYLYSAFDKAIGHYRRYHAASLRKAAAVAGLREEKLFFLESTGVLLLLLNKFLVRKKYPSAGQVRFWQSVLIPVSKVLDPILGFRFGKSVIGVWKKQAL